jgi:hypothetical protein
MLCLTTAQKQWNCWSGTADTSEVLSQNKLFLLLNCFSRVFGHSEEEKSNSESQCGQISKRREKEVEQEVGRSLGTTWCMVLGHGQGI